MQQEQPHQLECKVQYCSNPITTVNNNGHNFDFTWNNQLTNIGNYITYPCKSGMAFESRTAQCKWDSPSSIKVYCGKNGEYKYPYPWPQCSDITYCGHPPQPTEDGHIKLPDPTGRTNYCNWAFVVNDNY